MSKPCPNCGAGFEPLQGKYAPDGTIVCAPCGERMLAAAQKLERKNVGSAFFGAWGALLIALLSFGFRFRFAFFLMPLLAVVGGGGVVATALMNEKAGEALGWKRIPTVIIGGFAGLLGLVSLVLGFMN